MYRHITQFLAKREPAPIELKTHIREDKVERVTFFTQQNFQQTMHEPDSQLNVEAFDDNAFAGVIEQVVKSGIEITTVADLKERDDQWMQKIYDLENAIDEDIPDTDVPTPQPLEEYAKVFTRKNIRTDAWFIALDGDQYVGLSTLSVAQYGTKKSSMSAA